MLALPGASPCHPNVPPACRCALREQISLRQPAEFIHRGDRVRGRGEQMTMSDLPPMRLPLATIGRRPTTTPWPGWKPFATRVSPARTSF